MHTLLFGSDVFLMADVFGTHTNTHMRSSWQRSHGANNRLGPLACIQVSILASIPSKNILVFSLYNEFILLGLHDTKMLL